MKNIFNLFTLTIFSAFFFSCSNDEVTTTVNYRLSYNGDPLVIFKHYQYPDGKPMFFTRFSFFIENLTLTGAEKTYTLIDRDYINVTNAHLTGVEAATGYSLSTISIPPGDYQVTFGMGVSPVENGMEPASFAADNVLSNTSEYWTPWGSYIFNRIEGKIDLKGIGEIEDGFALHMGADQAYRNINLGPYTVSEDNPSIDIEFQVDKLFGNGADLYDIAANPQIHRLDQNAVMMTLVDKIEACYK